MNKPHAEPSYDRDLTHVHHLVETMAGAARNMLVDTLEALATGDSTRAKLIPPLDRVVNELEVEIDEQCLSVLARWQPVASDLRFIAATLKVVTDLERIGDESVHICEAIIDLQGEPMLDPPVDLTALGTAIRGIVEDAFEALRKENVQAAGQVIERGQRVYALVREVLRGCFRSRERDARSTDVAIRVHEIAGHLQRIAGHGTNIAEMVIFLVRGEDVRHVNTFERT